MSVQRTFILLGGLIMLALALPSVASEGPNRFETVDALPAAERYRVLSLMLMVSNGVDGKLLDAMERSAGEPAADGQAQDATGFEFDQYTTPLIRIVDQQTMVTGAARLFRFTEAHSADISSRLEALLEAEPQVTRSTEAASIVEDAIIIRTAIADSIDYIQATKGDGANPQLLSAEYRERTIFLRNNLEFESYEAELDRLTGEAIAQVGGQTDAYERMFDDEVDGAALNKKIDAAEAVYGWDPDKDRRAAKLAEEILENIWDRESDFPP